MRSKRILLLFDHVWVCLSNFFAILCEQNCPWHLWFTAIPGGDKHHVPPGSRQLNFRCPLARFNVLTSSAGAWCHCNRWLLTEKKFRKWFSLNHVWNIYHYILIYINTRTTHFLAYADLVCHKIISTRQLRKLSHCLIKRGPDMWKHTPNRCNPYPP